MVMRHILQLEMLVATSWNVAKLIAKKAPNVWKASMLNTRQKSSH